MAISLPDQCPTGVVYTPPRHAVKSYRSQAGSTHRTLFGNLSFDAKLALEYQLRNEVAAAWMRSFEQARGEFLEVLITGTPWEGAEDIGATVPGHIRWHFAEAPRLERIFRTRARLSLNLTGDLETS